MIAILNNTPLTIILDYDNIHYVIKNNDLVFISDNNDIFKWFESIKYVVEKLYNTKIDDNIRYLYKALFDDNYSENIEDLRNKIIITKNINLPNDNNLKTQIIKSFKPFICDENIFVKSRKDGFYIDTEGRYVIFKDERYFNINVISSLKTSKNSFILRIMDVEYLKCIKSVTEEELRERLGPINKIVDIKIEE